MSKYRAPPPRHTSPHKYQNQPDLAVCSTRPFHHAERGCSRHYDLPKVRVGGPLVGVYLGATKQAQWCMMRVVGRLDLIRSSDCEHQTGGQGRIFGNCGEALRGIACLELSDLGPPWLRPVRSGLATPQILSDPPWHAETTVNVISREIFTVIPPTLQTNYGSSPWALVSSWGSAGSCCHRPSGASSGPSQAEEAAMFFTFAGRWFTTCGSRCSIQRLALYRIDEVVLEFSWRKPVSNHPSRHTTMHVGTDGGPSPSSHRIVVINQ